MTTIDPPITSDTLSAPSVASADAGAAGGAALIHAAEADTLPTSFGVKT